MTWAHATYVLAYDLSPEHGPGPWARAVAAADQTAARYSEPDALREQLAIAITNGIAPGQLVALAELAVSSDDGSTS